MDKLTGNYKHVQKGIVFKKLVLYVECYQRVPFSTHDKWVDYKVWKKADLEDYIQLVRDGVLK